MTYDQWLELSRYRDWRYKSNGLEAIEFGRAAWDAALLRTKSPPLMDATRHSNPNCENRETDFKTGISCPVCFPKEPAASVAL